MARTWKIELVAPPGLGTELAAALEDLVPVIRVTHEEQESPSGAVVVLADRLRGYLAERPDTVVLRAIVADIAARHDIRPPDMDMIDLPDIDWVAENQKSFAPQEIEPFYIHDADHRRAVTRRLRSRRPISIEINANIAFGTGTHATTRTCLQALGRIAKSCPNPPGPILDMGCGTAILAIAAAKLFAGPVIASDIDNIAVVTGRTNARENGVARRIRVLAGPGYRSRAIAASGPYGLILANILARPLARMAADLDRHLALGGRAILSGLLTTQERQVLVPHLARGLALEARIVSDGWSTLVLSKLGKLPK